MTMLKNNNKADEIRKLWDFALCGKERGGKLELAPLANPSAGFRLAGGARRLESGTSDINIC